MPSRARIVPRMYQGLGRQVGGTTYGFHNPQPEIDARGARALDTDYSDALRQEQHAASERYQQMHAELELAKLRREEVHDMEKAQRRIKYEAMMEKAIPELYAIDPADPQATQKHAAFAERWPQLLHSDPGYPSIMQEFHQHIGMASESAKQRDAITARKEAADQRATDKAEAAKAAVEERKQRDKEHQDFLREMHPPKTGPSDAVRERYTKSAKNADDLKSRLDLNKGYIDALEARAVENSKSPLSDEEEKRLVALKKSHETIQNDYNRELGRKEALEMVHPELSPDYVPKPGEGAPSPAAAASPGAIDTAQTDVPAVRDTAPVSGGTATPSGDMVPLTGAAVPVPPAAAITTTGEDAVPNLSGAPAAVAPIAPPAAVPTGEDVVPNLSAVAPAPPATPMPPPAVAAPVAPAPVHPLEGKRVKHKETGQGGTIVNGEFVPDETEALQDQPAA